MSELKYEDTSLPFAREAALFGVASEIVKDPRVKRGLTSPLPIIDVGRGKGAMAAAINRLREEYGYGPATFIGIDKITYPDGMDYLYDSTVLGDAASAEVWKQVGSNLHNVKTDLIIGTAIDPKTINALSNHPAWWSPLLSATGIVCFPTKDEVSVPSEIPAQLVPISTPRDNLILIAKHMLILEPQTAAVV